MATPRIRRRPGRPYYEIRVKELDGWRWLSTGTADLQAARSWQREHERRAADPAYHAEASATVADAVEAYAQSRVARGRSAGTLHHVRVKSGHLLRLLPPMLRDVTHAVLEAFIAQRRAEGAAQTTIKKELRVCGAVLLLASRNGRFARRLEAVMPELEDTYTPRTRALDPWELVALAEYLPPERAAHVVWICATGARWGESLAARRDDQTAHAVRLRGTKTALAAREVPILEMTAPMLAWARDRAPERSGGQLFALWANVRRDLAQACAAVGILPVTPNDLRRSLATWLRAAGVEPSLIAVVLGHADGRMVERVYGRIVGDALRAALERSLGTK